MAKNVINVGIVNKLEVILEGFFLKKLPALPSKVKEIIVKVIPWLVIVVLFFSLRPLMMSGFMNYRYVYGYGFVWLMSIVSMILMAVAIPGMIKQKASAWKLMFYSGLIMAIYNLVTMNLGDLIIGGFISMYILFQIKGNYK